MKNISVCIATYNGEKYINEQLLSILNQLSENDEIIISDDTSTDHTINIIKLINDDRIKIFKFNSNRNPSKNFENAINNSNGDIIILADQDDIWLENKVNIINKYLQNNDKIALIVCDNIEVTTDLKIINESLFSYLNSGKGLLKNIIRNTYLGCNISFKKELLQYCLPFPKNIPMYDVWIGLIAEIFSDTMFIDEKTMLHRRHNDTYTPPKTSLLKKIRWRIYLISNLCFRYMQIKLKGQND